MCGAVASECVAASQAREEGKRAAAKAASGGEVGAPLDDASCHLVHL
eukprot:SAG25_NODE_3442_length_1082_cov_1.445575_1_plen_46_part_01